MANIYSRPTQSQYVPTYQPLPIDAIIQGAQARQKRHEQNYATLNRLQTAQKRLKDYMLKEDEPVLRNQLGAVQKRLDEIADKEDFSDASRQIRDVASTFQEEVQTGDLAKAFENFSKVQEKYKKIEESDLSQTEKERRKNAIIKGYKGVGEGGLDLNINQDYTDIEKYAEDTLGDYTPREITQFISTGAGKDLPERQKRQLENFAQGEATIEQLPVGVAKAMLRRKVANDPEALAGLRQRARVDTAGQDTFYSTDEDGNQIEVSREEKMGELVNQYIDSAATTQAGLNTSVDVDLTQTAEGQSEGEGSSLAVLTRGNTIARKVGIDNFRGAAYDIGSMRAVGRDQEADQLESTFNQALTAYRDSDENIDDEDIRFMMNNFKKMQKNYKGAGSGGEHNPYSTIGYNPERYDFLPEDKKQKFRNLADGFNEWLDKSGGFTETGVTTGDKDARQDINFLVQGEGPGNFKIFGRDDVNSKEFLSSESGTGEGISVLDTFQFQKVLESHDGLPTRIVGTVTKGGEPQTVQLDYKRPPNFFASDRDIEDVIIEKLGPFSESLKEKKRFEGVNPTFNYENFSDKLPSNIRAQSPHSYIGLKKSKNGVLAKIGSDEENARPITVGHVIENLYKMTPRNEEAALNNLDQSNLLTKEEKELILSGGLADGADLSNREQTVKQQVLQKLNTQFDQPYAFKTPMRAAKASANAQPR